MFQVTQGATRHAQQDHDHINERSVQRITAISGASAKVFVVYELLEAKLFDLTPIKLYGHWWSAGAGNT